MLLFKITKDENLKLQSCMSTVCDVNELVFVTVNYNCVRVEASILTKQIRIISKIPPEIIHTQNNNCLLL